MTDPGNAPAPAAGGEGAGAEHVIPDAVSASALFQTKAFEVGRIKQGVTDIPEVRAYAERVSARLRSMRKLAVEERKGKYAFTVAEIRFSDNGEIDAPDAYAPTEAEAAAILEAWPRYHWPQYQPCLFTGQHEPRCDDRFPWSFADTANLAVCWDRDHEHILAVEERRPRDGGAKDIWIWTCWDDGQWRPAEPPESLPLYGLDSIADAATIMVHEGPKAAKAVQALIADDDPETGWRAHPWGAELRGVIPGAVAHVGWMGGANRPEATDFSPLPQSGARIVCIADNDREGIDAISRISRRTGMKMEAVLFTDDWPLGFDLADPFPKGRAKAGTRMADLTVPATWLTEREHSGEPGPPRHRLRRNAISEWRYTITPPMFFHASDPSRGLSDAELDAMERPFSHVEHPSRLIRRHLSARADGIAYRPGEKPLIERNGRRLVNVWPPSRIREREGSAGPFARLLVHAFPVRRDRREVARFGATLAALPDRRMLYAPVLRSEAQGTGKTTLANIAAALVGEENVARPNEVALTEGNFNSHLARKRLVIVDELYTGHSRKTYNRLKSPITDPTVRVNEKYQPAYEIDNFAHFIFSSNDAIPIFIDPTDRRFFIPRMSEVKLPRQFWVRFYAWLADGGLGIIMRCAREWVERHGAVPPGAEAPMTAAKASMIENSVSDEMRSVREAVADLVERGTGDEGQRIAVTLEDFQRWHCDLCRDRGWKRLTGNRLTEELRRAGMRVRGRDDKLGVDYRVRIGGRKLPVACNFDPGDGAEAAEAVRIALKSMSDLGREEPL